VALVDLFPRQARIFLPSFETWCRSPAFRAVYLPIEAIAPGLKQFALERGMPAQDVLQFRFHGQVDAAGEGCAKIGTCGPFDLLVLADESVTLSRKRQAYLGRNIVEFLLLLFLFKNFADHAFEEQAHGTTSQKIKKTSLRLLVTAAHIDPLAVAPESFWELQHRELMADLAIW
jgi:hypothetical protein